MRADCSASAVRRNPFASKRDEGVNQVRTPSVQPPHDWRDVALGNPAQVPTDSIVTGFGAIESL